LLLSLKTKRRTAGVRVFSREKKRCIPTETVGLAPFCEMKPPRCADGDDDSIHSPVAMKGVLMSAQLDYPLVFVPATVRPAVPPPRQEGRSQLLAEDLAELQKLQHRAQTLERQRELLRLQGLARYD
jgi:hypothetical protein